MYERRCAPHLSRRERRQTPSSFPRLCVSKSCSGATLLSWCVIPEQPAPCTTYASGSGGRPWPPDTRAFITACLVCARGKASHAGPCHPLSTPLRPWSHIAVDFGTSLPSSEGHPVILMIVGRFSKAAHIVPLPKLPSAAEMVDLLVRHVFHLHRLPRDCPQFTSRMWRAFCTALGASISLSSGYHPQSNGQTERTNQSLSSSLQCVTARHPAAWNSYLPWVKYAHNSHVSASTGISPFMASLGYHLPCSSSRRRTLQCHTLGRTSDVAEGSGGRYVRLSSALLSRHKGRRTITGPPHQRISWDRGSGYPRGTFHSR